MPPTTPAPTAYSATPSPTTSAAVPTSAELTASGLRLELRGALRGHGVRLAHEAPVLQLAVHQDLAALPERVRHGAAVLDRCLSRPVRVLDREAQGVARLLDRPH